jgi:hypothetical protein
MMLKYGADDQQIWALTLDARLFQKMAAFLMIPGCGCPVVVQRVDFGVADQGQKLAEAEWTQRDCVTDQS